MDIREKSIELMDKVINNQLPHDTSSRIENEVYSLSNIIDGNFQEMLYSMYVVKAIENLKNPYVINLIKNESWKPEILVGLDKDDLNPDKWQRIQDIRLPKNIKIEKRKGLNKCPKCHSWYTEYTTAQTRSADEPSTLFFFCTDCEYRWKM